MYTSKDYLLDFELIISPERAKRPLMLEKEILDNKIKKEELENCPFCPGNEDKTPGEYWRIEINNNWIIRVFPNKYKIWKWHDLIVDTPDHFEDWDQNRYLDLVLAAIQKRVKELYKVNEIKYVQIFRNYGKESGASIRHSHLQIVGFDFIPKHIENLKFKLNKCSCKICRGKWKKEKVIKEFNFFRVIALDARFPYEIEIHIKEHKNFLELSTEELKELAFILSSLIRKIKLFFDSYNVLFFTTNDDFHFFIRLFPRKNKWGGLELSSNIFVNPYDKNKCYEFYKDCFD